MKANLLMSLSGCIATSAGVFVTTMEVQQGQPGSAPGGTPSKQPAPRSPTPPPANPTPRPADPAPQPSNPAPAPNNPVPVPVNPEQPGNNQPNPNQPGQQTPIERQPGRTPLNRQPGSSTDNPRFFTFNDPTMEPRFRESATRLSNLERGMADRNQRMVQRLGSIRQLPAERQNGAVMDLLQDILQENAQLQQYLAQSRTLITGDLVDPNQQQQNSGTQSNQNQPNTNQPNQNQPASNQPGSSQPPSNPPR